MKLIKQIFLYWNRNSTTKWILVILSIFQFIFLHSLAFFLIVKQKNVHEVKSASALPHSVTFLLNTNWLLLQSISFFLLHSISVCLLCSVSFANASPWFWLSANLQHNIHIESGEKTDGIWVREMIALCISKLEMCKRIYDSMRACAWIYLFECVHPSWIKGKNDEVHNEKILCNRKNAHFFRVLFLCFEICCFHFFLYSSECILKKVKEKRKKKTILRYGWWYITGIECSWLLIVLNIWMISMIQFRLSSSKREILKTQYFRFLFCFNRSFVGPSTIGPKSNSADWTGELL